MQFTVDCPLLFAKCHNSFSINLQLNTVYPFQVGCHTGTPYRRCCTQPETVLV